MAENKKSFIAYCDWGAIFDELSNEEAGKLVKHLFNYVRDKNPESDKITSLIFIPIKQTLKRDLVSWGKKSEKRAEIGRKGGIASGKIRASKSKQKQANEAIGLKSKQTKQNEHDSVSVSVSVSDKDKKPQTKKPSVPKEDFLKTILDTFKGSYESIRGSEYISLNNGKERKGAGSLINYAKKKYPKENSEQILTRLNDFFDECNQIDDKYHNENMSVSHIANNMNRLKTILERSN